MAKFEKFLFSYSIVAITVFFISFGILYPNPLNLISGILMFPILFYFWVRLTSPQAVSAERWTYRFLSVLTVLIALGIFCFQLSRQFFNYIPIAGVQPDEKQAQSEEPDTKTADLKEPTLAPIVKGANINDLSVTDIISETPQPQNQRITAIPGVETVDVYQKPLASSAKIGSLEAGVNYPYMVKEENWYKIVLTSQKTGWVSAEAVKEVY